MRLGLRNGTQFLALITGALFSSLAMAGGMTSSGGDYKSMDWESAWFLGQAPISYCIEIAPGEGLKPDQAKADFESAIAIWKTYTAERLSRSSPGHELNFNYQYENCQASTRLKIYVGATNADVQRGISLYQKPYSFALRTAYDEKSGLGQGLLWFAPRGSVFPGSDFPNWSAPYTFHGMLLHEMGHVLGCGHVEGTIMDSSLVSKLQDASSNDPRWAAGGKMYMTQVDHHQYLLIKRDSNLKMSGQIHPDFSGREPSRVFELLTGRKVQGKIRATVTKTGGTLRLSYQDDLGTESFDMSLAANAVSEFSLGGQVFHTVRESSDGLRGESTGPTAYSYVTSLRSKRNQVWTAIVNINGSGLGRPIEVQFMEGAKLTSAFRADLWLTAGIE